MNEDVTFLVDRKSKITKKLFLQNIAKQKRKQRSGTYPIFLIRYMLVYFGF